MLLSSRYRPKRCHRLLVAHQTQTISKPQIHQQKFACESFALLEIFPTQTTPTFTPLPSLRYRSRPHIPKTLDKPRNAPNYSFKTLEKHYWGKKKSSSIWIRICNDKQAENQQCAQTPPFCKILAQDNPLTHSLPPSLPAVPNKCHLARKKRIRVWLSSPVWKRSTYFNPRLSFVIK